MLHVSPQWKITQNWSSSTIIIGSQVFLSLRLTSVLPNIRMLMLMSLISIKTQLFTALFFRNSNSYVAVQITIRTSRSSHFNFKCCCSNSNSYVLFKLKIFTKHNIDFAGSIISSSIISYTHLFQHPQPKLHPTLKMNVMSWRHFTCKSAFLITSFLLINTHIFAPTENSAHYSTPAAWYKTCSDITTILKVGYILVKDTVVKKIKGH